MGLEQSKPGDNQDNRKNGGEENKVSEGKSLRFSHVRFTSQGNSDQSLFANSEAGKKAKRKLTEMRKRYGLPPKPKAQVDPSALTAGEEGPSNISSIEADSEKEQLKPLGSRDKKSLYDVKHKIKKIEPLVYRFRDQIGCDPDASNSKQIIKDIEKLLNIRLEASAYIKAGIIDCEPEEFLKKLNKAHTDLMKYLESPEQVTPSVKKQQEQKKSITSDNGDYTEDIDESLENQQIVKKRITRIKALLESLPNSRPTLQNIPREEWWLLYIDKQDHNDAKKLPNPGTLYDQQASPGYQRGMLNLFDALEQTRGQERLDYEGYTRLHELATEHTKKPEDARQPNGYDLLFKLAAYQISQPKNRQEQLEQLAALQEMCNEHFNGLPLYQDCPTSIEIPANLHQLQGIVAGRILTGREYPDGWGKGNREMLPLYSLRDGPQHINAILKSYYEGRKAQNQTEYQRLRAIADTIRALHVTHQKRDANGRTNVFGVLNKFLEEEGFSPTILPNGPDVFSGYKTLDGLVEDMLVGMHSFIYIGEVNAKMRPFQE